jgi:hypothetical protein
MFVMDIQECQNPGETESISRPWSSSIAICDDSAPVEASSRQECVGSFCRLVSIQGSILDTKMTRRACPD